MSDVVAAGLLLGVLAYSLFGGADFGAGFWDLTAGGARRGHRPRARIDRSLGPVWEANHTWLIYCLVVFWSGFPSAFTAVMSTLYLPLGLAALVSGVLVLGILVLARLDGVRFAGRLLGPVLPITLVSLGAGTGALLVMRHASPRLVRALAATGVAALVVGWGLAQYPYLLGTHVTIGAAAAPRTALATLVAVFTVATALVVPSLALLYVLQQRSRLQEG